MDVGWVWVISATTGVRKMRMPCGFQSTRPYTGTRSAALSRATNARVLSVGYPRPVTSTSPARACRFPSHRRSNTALFSHTTIARSDGPTPSASNARA